MRIAEYLDQLKGMTPTRSVYAVAKLLDLKDETVRPWYLGTAAPSAHACMKIAQVLDLPIEQVLADVNAETEKDPKKRADWIDLARKYAACVVMATAITIGTSDDASATGPAKKTAEAAHVAFVQIMRVRRWLGRLLEQLTRRGSGRFPAYGS